MLRNYFIMGRKLIALQLAMLGAVVLYFLIKHNWFSAYSALLGGVAWSLPTLYFIYRLFRSNSYKNFIFIEGIKLLFSISLIIFIVFFIHIDIISFIIGYIATISAAFFMPLLLIKNKT
jgi:F0F1-type ATP synthase assembly protein I